MKELYIYMQIYKRYIYINKKGKNPVKNKYIDMICFIRCMSSIVRNNVIIVMCRSESNY